MPFLSPDKWEGLEKDLVAYSNYIIIKKGYTADSIGKEFQLAGSRRKTFSAVTLTIWNIVPLKVRSASTLLAFRKTLKTSSGNWLGGANGVSYFEGG